MICCYARIIQVDEMEETKYADLSRKLAENEKQLCKRISEECASDFAIAIDGSITKIKNNVDLMTEVVDKVESYKDSYGEAAEVVGKISDALSDTDQKIIRFNEAFVKLQEKAKDSSADISGKTAVLLEVLDDLVKKSKENEATLKDTCQNIQEIGKEYNNSIDAMLEGVKGLGTEIKNTEIIITNCSKQISENTDSFYAKTENNISVIDDIYTRLESLKPVLESLIEAISKEKEKILKVADDIQGTENKIINVSDRLGKIEESVDDYNKKIIDEISLHLSSVAQKIDFATNQTDNFSTLLLKSSDEVSGLITNQQKWKESYEEVFKEALKDVDQLIVDLSENRESVRLATKSMRDYQTNLQVCNDAVKKTTDEYVKSIQEANAPIIESFNIFKNDSTNANNKQIDLINELKEEQLKQKKLWLLGLLPSIIIIALQIISFFR